MRRVVITGLGIVSPVGIGIEKFWESMTAGQHGIALITHFDPEGFKSKLAAEVKDFDPLNYFSKTEARRMDLYCQYAMAAAAEAVSDSGIEGTVQPEDFGVYVGSGIGGMGTFMAEHDKLNEGGPRRVSPLVIPMMIGNIATGNIATRYAARGASLPIVTACATSTNTIGEAYRAIKHGYVEAIIAGGTEATVNPLAISGFINATALTQSDDPDRASIPFDLERSGFVMGEGAAIVILEEYERAQKRGADIYGEIVGYGNANDAYHITAPHPDGEGAYQAITRALKEACYEPGEPVYINAHGTSTPLNDKVETHALKRVFGDAASKLRISSTKSMTGHMLGAAGATEAIASLLALKNGIIPPTVGLRVPDPELDLDYTPMNAVEAQCSLALSTSLGFGGHSATLALRPYAGE